MNCSTLLLGSMLGVAIFVGLPAQAQTYTFQYYQYPNALATYAMDLSSDGQLVGSYSPDNEITYHGFIETNGNYKSIILNTGTCCVSVVAVNAGKLLGIKDGVGFLLDSKGTLTNIAVPVSQSTAPTSLNSKGVIVGTYQNSLVGIDQAAFVLQNGVYKTYSIPNSHDTQFNDINNAGVIVGAYNTNAGFTGFRLSGGTFTKIVFPGATSTIPTGINDAGKIVGNYTAQDGTVSVFYFDGTAYTDIRPPGAVSSFVAHIKNSGQVIGFYTDAGLVITRGFVGTPVGNADGQIARPGVE